MAQVQMDTGTEMDIEKINDLINVRNPSYLKQKIFEYCL